MTGWPVLEIELLWIVLFSIRIWPIHAKHIKIHQSLVITNFNRMNASGNQRCIALPFVISRMSLPIAVSWSVLSVFRHCASPLITPSSPDTKPWPLHLRRCCSPKSGSSGWSSVGRPRPEPSRRHMTWETRMTHTAHIIPQTCKILTKKTHSARATYCVTEKWPHYIYNFYQELLGAILKLDFWRSWTCQVILTAHIAQPQTNKWPVHPLVMSPPLSSLILISQVGSHPFSCFSLYNIHFTGMTYLDLRLLEIRKLQTLLT